MKPNLLLITTDQQRFDTIHAAGNDCILTPHLNWLADSGVSFTRAYTDAPICAPARATMITGMPHYLTDPAVGNFGQPTAADPARTLPGLLTAAGYQTKSVGKLHYHPPRCLYGFEHAEILEDYYRECRVAGLKPMGHGLGQNEMEPAISTVHENDSLTHWIAERAVNFLETRDPTRPFFLNVGFSKPHPPFDPPLSYWSLYQGRPVPPPVTGDWSKTVEDIDPGFLGMTNFFNRAERFSLQQLDDIRRAYYACITQIDYSLGLLFARLIELNLLGNTVIIFTSDHGEMLGDHHMGGKGVFLEGSAHIPLLLRIPATVKGASGWAAGDRCEQIVSLTDIMPTLLEAAGLPRPKELPSVSRSLLSKSLPAGRNCFFGAYDDQFTVIDGYWKYLFTSTGGGELLFDLENDPKERKNLAKLCREKRDELHRKLATELIRSRHPVADPQTQQLRILKPKEAAEERKAARMAGFSSRDHTTKDILH